MADSPALPPRGSAMLTPEQARALQRELGRQFEYLKRLRERMNKQRWPDDDPLALAVQDVIHAMTTLHFRASLLPGDLKAFGFADREIHSAAQPDARP